MKDGPMSSEHQKLLKKLATLRVDRAKGIAPHKPLLLLVILELEKLGQLEKPILKLTPELAFRFSAYWSIVAHRRTQPPDVCLPFHHTRTSRLWRTLKTDGSESKNRDSTRAIQFSDEFLDALESRKFREAAAQTLISNYFEDAEQIALYELSGTPRPADSDFLDEVVSQARDYFICASRHERRRSYENRFSSKHIDFLLCDRTTMQPVLAVELADTIDNRKDRLEHSFVDDAFCASFHSASASRSHVFDCKSPKRNRYARAKISRRNGESNSFRNAADDSSAPKCPCEASMVIRKAVKVKHAGK